MRRQKGYTLNRWKITCLFIFTDTPDEIIVDESPVDQEHEIPGMMIKGKTICVTGRWCGGLTRDQVQKLIENMGAKWTNYVNARTQLLVVGNSPGNKKIEDADKLGIDVITMNEFIDITLKK